MSSGVGRCAAVVAHIHEIVIVRSIGISGLHPTSAVIATRRRNDRVVLAFHATRPRLRPIDARDQLHELVAVPIDRSARADGIRRAGSLLHAHINARTYPASL